MSSVTCWSPLTDLLSGLRSLLPDLLLCNVRSVLGLDISPLIVVILLILSIRFVLVPEDHEGRQEAHSRNK